MDKKKYQYEPMEDVNNDRQIINDEKYNVEVAKDFSIPSVGVRMYDILQPTITGYTAGLITRDLVSIGEEMVKDKDEKDNSHK